jgi:predicted transglutaminase-like cysteine proteinase
MNLGDLKTVNSEINQIEYETEIGDDWVPAVLGGTSDCDGYATAKFERLVDMGWPTNFLRLATCYVETGEYHAVLLVDWDSQTYVLDNRHPLPMEYDLLPYRWHLLQVAGTQNWEHA